MKNINELLKQEIPIVGQKWIRKTTPNNTVTIEQIYKEYVSICYGNEVVYTISVSFFLKAYTPITL